MRRVKEAEPNMKIKGIISEYEKEIKRQQARDEKRRSKLIMKRKWKESREGQSMQQYTKEEKRIKSTQTQCKGKGSKSKHGKESEVKNFKGEETGKRQT
jgi:hypothetical protein